MKSAILLLAGFLMVPTAFAQNTGRVNWGNTSTTLIYTNCILSLGPVSGPNAYRFGLYVGPLGTPAGSLILVALATNGMTTGRFVSSNPQPLPPQFPAGTPISFQVRAWPLWAGASFEEASLAFPTGASDVGYVTPTASPAVTPGIFGTGPGQIGGFELTCLAPPLSTGRRHPDGPVVITRALPSSELTWANVITWAIAPATYVVQAAAAVTGPWTNLANVTSSTLQTTYTLPASAAGLRFYRVAWTNASPPEPVGTWDYQAFDSAGAVMAAGFFTFTSNVPSTVSFTFSRIQSGAQNSAVLLHPQGPGTMSAYSVGSPNNIEFFFSNEFRLRGQMVPWYYAGDWFATDYIINPPPGGPSFVIRTGRFVAGPHY